MDSMENINDFYLGDIYDHKARWMTFYFQINEVRKLKPKKTLEVGLGSGVTKDYLKKKYNHTTFDINPELKPDVVGDVRKMPFKDKEFDAVLCCEVLEHMPFEDFPRALKEIRRVGKAAVISLPDHRRTLLNFFIKMPFLKKWSKLVKVPSFRRHVFDSQHYWEIGKISYPPRRILAEMKRAGFIVERHFVPHQAPTTHFFILR